jgi:hypothetical protein
MVTQRLGASCMTGAGNSWSSVHIWLSVHSTRGQRFNDAQRDASGGQHTAQHTAEYTAEYTAEHTAKHRDMQLSMRAQ